MGVPVMDFHRKGNEYELYFPAEGKVVTGKMDETQERTAWDHTVMLSIRALDAVLGKISGVSSEEARVWKNNERYRIDLPANPILSHGISRRFYRQDLGGCPDHGPDID